MKHGLFVAAWALAISLGLGGQASAQWMERGFDPWLHPPVTATVLFQGTDSAIERPFQAVIRSQNDWEMHWRRHHGKGLADFFPAPRVVDWTREEILVVHLGSRPTSGWHVTIEGVTRRDSWFWDIHCVVIGPRPTDRVTPGMTRPFVIARVPKLVGNPMFSFRTVQATLWTGSWGWGRGCGAPPVWMVGAGGVLLPYTPPVIPPRTANPPQSGNAGRSGRDRD